MKIRTILIACIFMISTGQVAYADDNPKLFLKGSKFGYVVYAPDAKGGTLAGYQFDDTDYLGFGFGYRKPQTFGYYVDLKMTPDIINDSGNSDFVYRYLMLNGGMTFGITNQLTLLGGIGYSIQDGSVVRNDDHYSTEETNSDFNLNFGAMYQLSQSFGVITGYDTSSSAYSVGIALGF